MTYFTFCVIKTSFFRQKSLSFPKKQAILRGPRPRAMIICGQIARAKAATDLRIFMCSGRLGFFYL